MQLPQNQEHQIRDLARQTKHTQNHHPLLSPGRPPFANDGRKRPYQEPSYPIHQSTRQTQSLEMSRMISSIRGQQVSYEDGGIGKGSDGE
jgi:hypothetical protein